MIGSLALKTFSTHLLTGNLDSIDSIGSADHGTPKNCQGNKMTGEKSKFSNYFCVDSGENSPSHSSRIDYEVRTHIENHELDLRKIAIKNSMSSSLSAQQKKALGMAEQYLSSGEDEQND